MILPTYVNSDDGPLIIYCDSQQSRYRRDDTGNHEMDVGFGFEGN